MNEAERFLKERLAQQQSYAEAEATIPLTPTGPQQRVSFGTAWKYFWTRWTFKGRASRSEYWGATLMNFLASIATGLIVGLLLGMLGANEQTIDALGNVVGTLWNLATFVPGLCIWVRRLHDTNHSGWWALLAFLPIVGWIILFVFSVSRSDPQSNRYGPVPNTMP